MNSNQKHDSGHGCNHPARGLPVIQRSDIQSLHKNRLQFLFAFICVISGLLLSGCSMVSGKRRPDGTLVVTSWRFLWKSEAIRFTARDTNFVAVLSIGKSSSDDQSVHAVTEAVVTGLVKGFVP